jgi:hypothetical protein
MEFKSICRKCGMDHEPSLIDVLEAVKKSCACKGRGYCPACKVWNYLITKDTKKIDK